MDYLHTKFKKNEIRPHERLIIIGRTGSGKSVLMNEMLEYFGRKTLVVLIDTKREYAHLPPFSVEVLKKRKGLYRLYQLKYRGVVIDNVRVIVEFMAQVLFKRRNCILAVEELSYASVKHFKLTDKMPNLGRVITQGRSMNVGFIGTTQRPQQISTEILSQASHICCFDLTSKADLKAMEAYIEPEFFRKLNKHEFFHLNYRENYLNHCYKIYLKPDRREYYERIFGAT